MNLNKLTLEDIKQFADNPDKFEAGLLCYETSLINQFYMSGKGITAKVETKTGLYSVEIRSGGGNVSANCTCAAEGAVCEHRVAVLLYALYGDPNELVGNDADEEEEEFAEDSSASSIPDDLEAALRGMGVDKLVEMVLKFVEEFPEVRHLLLSEVNLSPELIQPPQKKQGIVFKLKQKIDDFFDETYDNFLEAENSYDEDRYYYDDYEDEDDVDCPDLDEVFSVVPTLKFQDQIDVLWKVVTEANQYFIDEDYLIGSDEVTTALKLFANAVETSEVQMPEKQSYLDSLLSLFKWEIFEDDELDGVIIDTLDLICTMPEDYLYVIQQLPECSNHENTLDWMANFYLQLGDEENFLRLREANLNEPFQYVELAFFWRDKGEVEKYRATLERWISRGRRNYIELDGRKTNTYYEIRSQDQQIMTELSEFYQEQGDLENLYRVLMLRLREHGYSLALYHQLKEAATGLKRWELTRKQVLEGLAGHLNDLVEIYLEEGEWDEAIALSQNSRCGQFTDLKIAKAVKEHRPQEAIAIYEKVVMQHIQGKTRSNYQIAAMHAQMLKSIYLDILKDASGWQGYIDKLRQTYRGYPALQDEFKGL
ncbi:SWIM zinc finger family protein [Oscillatoria acuminata]|uniref:SWIM-type domain-containing protein n=1 Tax=Oscillatoria acuminata PCC 6304 TaxID=56110 RepID=K9TJV5_9CYAN|nr:SWIM zinc finger family protein [Oscillatoria acuminata]AFY83147.1 hypothetical protein Oscil6304_3584 [Oscillatoria acuminata PCC 6304]